MKRQTYGAPAAAPSYAAPAAAAPSYAAPAADSYGSPAAAPDSYGSPAAEPIAAADSYGAPASQPCELQVRGYNLVLVSLYQDSKDESLKDIYIYWSTNRNIGLCQYWFPIGSRLNSRLESSNRIPNRLEWIWNYVKKKKSARVCLYIKRNVEKNCNFLNCM